MPLVQGKEHIFHCSEDHQACWDMIMALLQVGSNLTFTLHPLYFPLSIYQYLPHYWWFSPSPLQHIIFIASISSHSNQFSYSWFARL